MASIRLIWGLFGLPSQKGLCPTATRPYSHLAKAPDRDPAPRGNPLSGYHLTGRVYRRGRVVDLLGPRLRNEALKTSAQKERGPPPTWPAPLTEYIFTSHDIASLWNQTNTHTKAQSESTFSPLVSLVGPFLVVPKGDHF